MFKEHFLFIVMSFLGCLFFVDSAQAHPMDAGRMQIQILENRAIFELRMHTLAVESLLNKPVDAQHATELEDIIFKATFGQSTPLLNNEICEWRRPTLSVEEEKDKNTYLNLQAVAVCALARLNTESIEMNLPFLNSMSSVFKMLTTIQGLNADKNEAINLILTPKETKININPNAYNNQNIFIKLGMAHIGVDKGEWVRNDELHWPEGIDHVLFVLAIVLISSSLFSTIQNATGFTIGHTLTLVLSTYQIIHVHSHWVEALIALSIAVVVGLSFLKKPFEHGFFLNLILGTLHGLGFASVIQDLQLPQNRILPTLFSFNLGVELGQIVIILLTFGVLYILKKRNQTFYVYFTRALRFIIFILSLFWFIERGFT